MKPGGTGSPRRVISARLAPLPPRSAFIDASPSSSRYTHFSGGALRRAADGDLRVAAFGRGMGSLRIEARPGGFRTRITRPPARTPILRAAASPAMIGVKREQAECGHGGPAHPAA